MEKPASEDNSTLRWALMWGLIALTAYFFFLFTSFKALSVSSDATTYASIARSIMRGQGAVSGILQPVGFANVSPDDIREAGSLFGPHPQFLWSLVLSLAFMVLGPSDAVSALTCGLFYIASVPLIFLLAGRLFDERAAHLAAALTILNERMLYYSISGLSESMFTFLLILLVYLLVRSGGLKIGIGAGIVGALVFISREIGPLYAVPWLLLIVVDSEYRWRRIFGLLLGFMVVFAANQAIKPVLAYQWDGPNRVPIRSVQDQNDEAFRDDHQTPEVEPLQPAQVEKSQEEESFLFKFVRNKFQHVILVHSPLYPGHSYPRGLNSVDFEATLSDHWDAFVDRTVHYSLPIILKAWFLNGTNPLLLLCFWVAPLLAIRSKKQLLPWLATVGSLLCVGLVLLVIFVMQRYFHPVIPMMIVFAAGGFSRIVGLFKKRSLSIAISILLVLIATYRWGIVAGIDREHRVTDPLCYSLTLQNPKYANDLSRIVEENTTPEMVGVSDTPWLVAWYGDRYAIWLPNDMHTLKELQKRTNVDFMLFTFRHPNVNVEFWEEWLNRVSEAGGELDGFKFKAGFARPGGRLYLFRSDTRYVSDTQIEQSR